MSNQTITYNLSTLEWLARIHARLCAKVRAANGSIWDYMHIDKPTPDDWERYAAAERDRQWYSPASERVWEAYLVEDRAVQKIEGILKGEISP